MSDVFLRHPDLPPDQWIEVPAESRPHYSTAGWQLVPDGDVRARADAAAHVLATAEAQMAGLPLPPAPTNPATAADPADVGPADVGPADVGPADVGPADVDQAAVDQAAADPAQDPPAGPDATTTTAPAAPKTRSK